MAVLVAIAIPVFGTQLEKAREATDLANVKSAYAEAVSEYLEKNDAVTKTYELTSNPDDCKQPAGTNVAGVDAEKILKTATATITVEKDGIVKINNELATTSFGSSSGAGN